MKFKKYSNYDVMIVGAGISGLYAAINLDRRLRVLLLSKKEFAACNSALAQGGIAVALDTDSDSVEAHVTDTLKAGGCANNRANLRIMVENAVKDYEELVELGVDFDDDLGLEGGHSFRRIVHCKDSTGNEIVSVLSEKVKSLENIDCIEYAHLLRLEKHGDDFFAEISIGSECKQYASAGSVIIATGGIGRVYDFTTNSAISTGDGIQFAFNLGAIIKKMNLIQFHPTAFFDRTCEYSEDEDTLLITEATRGEGAFIYNKNKERFCDELDTRDRVSRRIIEEEKRIGSSEFYLDVSFLDSDFIKTRFPMICERLLEKGYDFTKEPVPIYPCQHYLMGGIEVNAAGQTNINGLFAMGECAFTGVHGVNRLASNSLLEALVFSRLTAEHINNNVGCVSPRRDCASGTPIDADIFDNHGIQPLPKGLCSEIRAIMQKAFFVVPDYDEVREGFERITEIKTLLDGDEFAVTPDFVEVRSLATVAYLILKEVMDNAS